MKHIKYAWVLAVLCLLLTACATKENTTAPNTPAPGTTMAQSQLEEWTYDLSVTPVTVEEQAEDGRVVAESSYQVPEMTVYHADGTPYDMETESGDAVAAAQAFNAYYQDWLTNQQSWFGEMAEAAQADYADRGTEGGGPWENETYRYADDVQTTFWHNDHMACVTHTSYSFTGGAHGLFMRTAAAFDMATGKHFSLEDLVSDYSGLLATVEEEILRQIEPMVADGDEGAFFSDYPETVKDWADREIFFGDDNLTVVFSVYDIAPYAAGEQAFSISYELIEPYLNDYGRIMLELA